MIKIMGGKRYDTDRAERVFHYWNGYGAGDFKYRTKSLYRTANGAWFIHHEGGALTDMARSAGSSGVSGSSDIEAICEDDAYGFLEAHSDDDEALVAIETYFSNRVKEA